MLYYLIYLVFKLVHLGHVLWIDGDINSGILFTFGFFVPRGLWASLVDWGALWSHSWRSLRLRLTTFLQKLLDLLLLILGNYILHLSCDVSDLIHVELFRVWKETWRRGLLHLLLNVLFSLSLHSSSAIFGSGFSYILRILVVVSCLWLLLIERWHIDVLPWIIMIELLFEEAFANTPANLFQSALQVCAKICYRLLSATNLETINEVRLERLHWEFLKQVICLLWFVLDVRLILGGGVLESEH